MLSIPLRYERVSAAPSPDAWLYDMNNATQEKFGYPATLIAEGEHWTVQLRPAQPTLGALVLVCKQTVSDFGAVSPAGFAELGILVRRIESVLRAFIGYERINYLMLMMVDKDVHFHVIPRYSGERQWRGRAFADAGWPGPPALSQAVALDKDDMDRLTTQLRDLWCSS